MKAPVIAKQCGISERQVTRIRTKRGTPGRLGPPVLWSDEDLAWAKELLEDGASYREVAESTGISNTTLRDKFPGMGFTEEDTALLATYMSKMPEHLKLALIRPTRYY